jgi:hypothetical protein
VSFTTDLVQGTASKLATASLVTYRSDGSAYLSTETAAVFSLMPQGPDRCVVLTAYLALDQAVEPLSTIGLQLRFRGNQGDPLDVNNLADSAFQTLQALSGVQMGSVWVVQFLRQSMIPLGQDDSLRWERSDNYYVDINPPSTAYRN